MTTGMLKARYRIPAGASPSFTGRRRAALNVAGTSSSVVPTRARSTSRSDRGGNGASLQACPGWSLVTTTGPRMLVSLVEVVSSSGVPIKVRSASTRSWRGLGVGSTTVSRESWQAIATRMSSKEAKRLGRRGLSMGGLGLSVCSPSGGGQKVFSRSRRLAGGDAVVNWHKGRACRQGLEEHTNAGWFITVSDAAESDGSGVRAPP